MIKKMTGETAAALLLDWEEIGVTAVAVIALEQSGILDDNPRFQQALIRVARQLSAINVDDFHRAQ